MGQKIHPTGFRLSVSRNWSSRWYANSRQFPQMLNEDLRVRAYLRKKLVLRCSNACCNVLNRFGRRCIPRHSGGFISSHGITQTGFNVLQLLLRLCLHKIHRRPQVAALLNQRVKLGLLCCVQCIVLLHER